MTGASKILNGYMTLTTALSGVVCHLQARPCYDQLSAKFKVSTYAGYEDRKGLGI